MEDGTSKQIEMWKLLGDTQAVVDATGRSFVRPGKAMDEAQRKGRESVDALDLGKSGTAWAKAGAANRGRAHIAPAKYGNRHIVVVRRRKD